MPTTTMMRILDGPAARLSVDATVAMHTEIYTEPQFRGVPYFAESAFRDRLAVGTRQSGFHLVLAETDDNIAAGCLYGWSLASWTRWWTPLRDRLPAHVTDETGSRTVFIQEIMVRAAWRRQGIARRMHDAFLAGRTEERALLCVQPDNEPARSAYLRWGWRELASTRFTQDGPVFDCFVKPLPGTPGR
ncbi:MAG TPA: GNAT family N-acetyltransferase [Pseudonocardiaceae bacterium]|nr:GNAT family N-acetyltransferase [Pseudonocardiaceae bacterium]